MHIPKKLRAQQQVSPAGQVENRLHLVGPGGGPGGGLGLDLVGYDGIMLIPQIPLASPVFRCMYM